MGRAEWGRDPEFFGPRHAYRETLILRAVVARAVPSLHLDCASGVGSLAVALAKRGSTVIAADLSLRSLAVTRSRAIKAGVSRHVLPVVADITALPFASDVFPSISTTETLEHIPADAQALQELGRVLTPAGRIAGTVPHGPRQWSTWDDWAGHLRRYTKTSLRQLLATANLRGRVQRWGWPLMRLYDGLFLKQVNARRLKIDRHTDDDPVLRSVKGLGRRRALVALVTAAFSIDRLFPDTPWGVGMLFVARKKDIPPSSP
jgi:SAM-dependent methyltransferase